LGKVFFGKESEKASEGKPVEELSGDCEVPLWLLWERWP
jgi:hypothetical protein